jgi:hypothetical protein
VNAPAPALANEPRRTVAMRLSDPAETLGYLSLVFGLLLVFFPVSFPRMIVQNWENARLTPTMILFTVLLNVGIYLRVAHRRSAKPGIIAATCLGGVPVVVLVGLNFWLQATIAGTLNQYISSAPARVNEEILAHTFFALIAAIFTPFLLIRFAQQFRQKQS